MDKKKHSISLSNHMKVTRNRIKVETIKYKGAIHQVVAGGRKVLATNVILEEAEKALEDFTDRDEEALTAARQECKKWHQLLCATGKEASDYADTHSEWTTAKAKLAELNSGRQSEIDRLTKAVASAQVDKDAAERFFNGQLGAKQRKEDLLAELNEKLTKLLAKYKEVKNTTTC